MLCCTPLSVGGFWLDQWCGPSALGQIWGSSHLRSYRILYFKYFLLSSSLDIHYAYCISFVLCNLIIIHRYSVKFNQNGFESQATIFHKLFLNTMTKQTKKQNWLVCAVHPELSVSPNIKN